jgi:hypothetical protein
MTLVRISSSSRHSSRAIFKPTQEKEQDNGKQGTGKEFFRDCQADEGSRNRTQDHKVSGVQ